MNELVIGGRTLTLVSSELSLELGAENFGLHLQTSECGDIRLFGYCLPPLASRSQIIGCRLELAVEDPADQFALAGADRLIAPMTDHDTRAQLVVEAVEDDRIVLSYHGPFLSIDPSGTTDDEPIDVQLRVHAAWTA